MLQVSLILPGFRCLTFGLIFLGALELTASTNQERFLLGNQLYQQAQFSDALASYAAIQTKTSGVWYNLGNCAYHLNQYWAAILFWKRAQLLELQQRGYATKLARQCAQNLVQAQAKLATGGVELGANYKTLMAAKNLAHPDLTQMAQLVAANLHSTRTAQPISHLSVIKSRNLKSTWYYQAKLKLQQCLIQIPLLFLQLLFLASLGGLVYVLIRLILPAGRPGIKIKLNWVYITGLLVLITSLASALYFKANFTSQNWAIVNPAGAALHLGPGANYPVFSKLKPAEFVKILGQNAQSWYAVQSEDGLQTGWTLADGLTRC